LSQVPKDVPTTVSCLFFQSRGVTSEDKGEKKPVATEPSTVSPQYTDIISINQSPTTTMAALGDDLLGIVNKLQDLVFNTIGSDSLDLPQIVRHLYIYDEHGLGWARLDWARFPVSPDPSPSVSSRVAWRVGC
jgi:hypothetical protein